MFRSRSTSWLPSTSHLAPGASRHQRWWYVCTLPSTPTSPRQTIVSSTFTISYQASIIALSMSCGVRNGRQKASTDALCPKCRSDQIQVVASSASHTSGPPFRARRIRACVCRVSTIRWTGGISDRSSSSMYSLCSRSAIASGAVTGPVSDPTDSTCQLAGSLPGFTALDSSSVTTTKPQEKRMVHASALSGALSVRPGRQAARPRRLLIVDRRVQVRQCAVG